MKDKPIARGLRNNNPGNLRKSRDPWQGLAAEQKDREFFTFQSPAYGIRALAVTLITYQDRHALKTVDAMIRRWAPPVENKTSAYIAAVALAMGVAPSEAIDVQDHATLKAMVKAIIRHENGQQPYGDAQIDEGLRLAGVTPPPPKSALAEIAKDPKVIAATAGSAIAGAQQAVAQASDIATTLGFDLRWMLWAGIAALALAGIWFAVTIVRERRARA
jgi:hypothetical protein